jgi:hypothetical protein
MILPFTVLYCDLKKRFNQPIRQAFLTLFEVGEIAVCEIALSEIVV